MRIEFYGIVYKAEIARKCMRFELLPFCFKLVMNNQKVLSCAVVTIKREESKHPLVPFFGVVGY